MCTVVCEWQPGASVRVLALRDEFTERRFDEPGRWWPERGEVVGGRDQTAGGTWCASQIDSGTTALLLNRTERFVGKPSRGILPLAAVTGDWPEEIDHREMAGFNLARINANAFTVWVWDATELRRLDLEPGLHLISSSGVDAADPKTTRFAPQFAERDWLTVVGECEPSDALGSLVVQNTVDDRTYATVFGQLITGAPGRLKIAHTRTPWLRDTWVEQSWST